jgi:phosphate uptake regulator
LEIRKLQKLKGGSYIVSLPRQWVEKLRLKSGEQIVMSEDEDCSLRIFPVMKSFEKPLEVTLSLEEYPDLRALKYSVVTYYIQGSNRINIVSKKIITAEQKREIKQFRAELPGVEVVEEEANKLSFQVLIDPAAFSVESLIERTFAFSLKLQEDATKSLINLDIPLAMEVLERSREVQRHYRFTIRHVALSALGRTSTKKVGVKNCQDCINFALTARDISRLIYHSSSIANHVLSLKGKKDINQEILGLIGKMAEAAYQMQKSAIEAFLKEDVKLATKVFGMMNDIRERERLILKRIMEKTTDVDVAVTLSMIARDIRRIAGHAVAIADDVMNRVLRPNK